MVTIATTVERRTTKLRAAFAREARYCYDASCKEIGSEHKGGKLRVEISTLSKTISTMLLAVLVFLVTAVTAVGFISLTKAEAVETGTSQSCYTGGMSFDPGAGITEFYHHSYTDLSGRDIHVYRQYVKGNWHDAWFNGYEQYHDTVYRDCTGQSGSPVNDSLW